LHYILRLVRLKLAAAFLSKGKQFTATDEKRGTRSLHLPILLLFQKAF
jgi:hypothetical protein